MSTEDTPEFNPEIITDLLVMPVVAASFDLTTMTKFVHLRESTDRVGVVLVFDKNSESAFEKGNSAFFLSTGVCCFVKTVHAVSLAEFAGVTAGDRLFSIGGKIVQDEEDVVKNLDIRPTTLEFISVPINPVDVSPPEWGTVDCTTSMPLLLLLEDSIPSRPQARTRTKVKRIRLAETEADVERVLHMIRGTQDCPNVRLDLPSYAAQLAKHCSYRLAFVSWVFSRSQNGEDDANPNLLEEETVIGACGFTTLERISGRYSSKSLLLQDFVIAEQEAGYFECSSAEIGNEMFDWLTNHATELGCDEIVVMCTVDATQAQRFFVTKVNFIDSIRLYIYIYASLD